MLSFFNRIAPIAVLSAPAFLAAAATAQVQPITPYYGFVTVDKSTVRCGENDRFYKVGELATGEVVLVDAEGSSWSRISYPTSFAAVVRVQDVKVEGTNATLTEASKLRAGNITGGFTPTSSWKPLVETPLPIGTVLKVLEPVKEADAIVAYKVVAPDTARAFVETRSLRHATDAEVTAFKSKGTLATLPANATPATPNTTKPNTTDTQKITTGPNTFGPNAVKPGPTTPANTPGMIGPVAEPAEVAKGPDTAKPAERKVGTYEALENRFKEVWKQEDGAAEWGELRSEYQRAIDKLPEGDDSTRKALQSRVKAMQIRVELTEKIRQQEEARASLDKNKSELAKQIEEWEKSRVYTIVGQLQPSTVYDGKHLPQMYRIVSVGGGSNRTLGYLKPSEEIDLNKRLGQVVGVIGDATMDRSLKLNIINPVKVDTLRAGPGMAAPTTTANVEEQGDTKAPAEK